MKKLRTFLRQLDHLDGLNLQIFFNPWWRNHVPFRDSLEPFRRTEFQNFLQPWWRNYVLFRDNFEHLDGLNFQIFFNHGEEITYLFGAFRVTEFPNFLQPWWKNRISFRDNLEHLDGLNFIQDILRPWWGNQLSTMILKNLLAWDTKLLRPLPTLKTHWLLWVHLWENLHEMYLLIVIK